MDVVVVVVVRWEKRFPYKRKRRKLRKTRFEG
jgi:hypothetical protein